MKLPVTILFIAFLLLEAAPSFSYSDSVKFRSPLDIPITLAGTFCEIRGSHFHAGIDIRTQGREGLNVYAIESGSIARIKISKNGYGKALYIQHPNGYTSVYAHLQKFNERIEQEVRKIQYAKESYEIDEYFPAGALPVDLGEIIALSGNSGRSAAPHLHFEIRDTKTEHPLNALAFLPPIQDNLAPVMNDLFVYRMDDSRGKLFPQRLKIIKSGADYALLSDTISVGFRQVGFGINTYDGNGAGGKNGVYELVGKANENVFFRFAMDRLSFDETRYALAHSDYLLNQRSNLKVHRLYKLPGDRFNYYDINPVGGDVVLDSAVNKISVLAKDFSGNAANLNFYIRYDSTLTSADLSTLDYDTIFDYRLDNTFEANEVSVFFPKGAAYDKLFFRYKRTGELIQGRTFSAIHRIHTEEEPLHLNYTLSIKTTGVPDRYKSKALIVRETKSGGLEAKESSWDGEYLRCRTRDFGKYYVVIDSIAPKIEPVNIYNNKTLTGLPSLQVKITDNLAGIKSYRGEVDGKWVLMEYDEKSDKLTYYFDWRTPAGSHTFTLVVTDAVGNRKTYEVKFTR